MKIQSQQTADSGGEHVVVRVDVFVDYVFGEFPILVLSRPASLTKGQQHGLGIVYRSMEDEDKRNAAATALVT
jgi:hypothetical protein